ncbi:hypothetical protein CsSME_00041025 [Camellia sinensis var. sinensis]
MACSAFARPLLKSHSSLLHHQPEKSKTLFSIPFINKPHPVSKTLFHSSPNAQFGLRASKKRNLLAGSTIKSKVRASAEGEAKSLGSDATYQEVFTWSSVILPFLFPALGGLLFGYDIGATSGATISLQSPELSGTTWFNLSAVQLGLAVSGSLYGALLGSILVYPIADFLGRRRELIIAALLYVLGGFVTAYAPGLGIFLLGRLLYGLGIGLIWFDRPCMEPLFILRRLAHLRFVGL